MNSRPMKKIAIVFACLLLVVAFGCDFSPRPERGEEILEAWTTTNTTFKVNVTAYSEKNGGFVPGAYYLFRSAAVDSDDWREIMTFRHDDPIVIPRDQVRFVDDRIGYVFMGWQFGVTTDSGLTWSIWSADKDLPDWNSNNYGSIRDVRVWPDGSGKMQLELFPRREEVTALYTKDYGRHWQAEYVAVASTTGQALRLSKREREEIHTAFEHYDLSLPPQATASSGTVGSLTACAMIARSIPLNINW